MRLPSRRGSSWRLPSECQYHMRSCADGSQDRAVSRYRSSLPLRFPLLRTALTRVISFCPATASTAKPICRRKSTAQNSAMKAGLGVNCVTCISLMAPNPGFTSTLHTASAAKLTRMASGVITWIRVSWRDTRCWSSAMAAESLVVARAGILSPSDVSAKAVDRVRV